MTQDTKAGSAKPKRPLTVDDIRHKAEHVRDVAKAEVRRATHEELTRNLAIAVGAVAFAVSFAYYMGSRGCARPRRRA